MKRVCSVLAVCTFFLDVAQAQTPVHFEDLSLKYAVEGALWVSEPTPADMLGLTSLTASDMEIADLTGLEYAANLQRLDLPDNAVSNLAPLSGLVNLQTLHLANNQIEDLSPLAGLGNLQELDLLENQVSDISLLYGLSSLEILGLERNRVSDISVLSGLYSLRKLNLHRNRISDLTPLLEFTWLEWLDVRLNPLNEEAYDVLIPQIQAHNPGMWFGYDMSNDRDLVVSAAAGGIILSPGEGRFIYQHGDVVRLEARANPGFMFVGWSGTYAGRENPAFVTMNQNYDARASFVSVRSILYVDSRVSSNAPAAEAAATPALENGTPEHPFDRIQEAIEVAPQGAGIRVRPGTYHEDIDSLYKSIQLMARDPNNPRGGPCAVIEGTGNGPAVQLTGLGVNCTLTGFIITGGKGQPAGAIYCAGTNPTIANCLIVGNRSTSSDGAAIYCQGSRVVLTNCTIVDNCAGEQGAALILMDSEAALVNSVLWGNTPNEVLSLGRTHESIRYCDVRGGWLDEGNLSSNPLFARRGSWVNPSDSNEPLAPTDERAVWVQGDYHLQSQAGRWDPAARTWVCDDISSPCLDAGDPVTPVGYESAPNGGVINLGAYGGTTAASKSPSPLIVP